MEKWYNKSNINTTANFWRGDEFGEFIEGDFT